MVLLGKAAKERVEEFRQALSVESDRGIFLVGAAFLEKELEVLLYAHFAFEDESRGTATDGSSSYKPKTSFAAKSSAALSSNLILKWEHRKLDLIRKVRNEFAHTVKATSFESADVKQLIQELTGFKEITRSQVIDMVTHLGGLIIARVLLLSSSGLDVETKRFYMRFPDSDPIQYI